MNHLENKAMILSFFAGVTLQVVLSEAPPLARLFGTVSLGVSGWLTIIGISVMPLVVHEIVAVCARFRRSK
jgi:Ca2+-transporting ATPase